MNPKINETTHFGILLGFLMVINNLLPTYSWVLRDHNQPDYLNKLFGLSATEIEDFFPPNLSTEKGFEKRYLMSCCKALARTYFVRQNSWIASVQEEAIPSFGMEAKWSSCYLHYIWLETVEEKYGS